MKLFGFGGILALIAAIWVIYDVWTNEKKMDQTNKIIWTICACIAGLNIITAIVYYFMVKRK